jgi:hypothetical protein
MHPSSKFVWFLASLTMIAAEYVAASPSVDRAVYTRAEALLGANQESKVLKAFVVPHWIGTTDEFW